MRGIEVTGDAFGFEALSEGGPGAHMFGCQHTLRHYKTAYWDSALDDNTPWETWDENGRDDMATRAHRRWKAQLAQYQPPPIDDTIDAALRAFVAQRKDAMPDMWH